MTRRQWLCGAVAVAARRRCEEVRRIAAADATQGVAADAGHLYAIANHSIGKHEKESGKLVARWECEAGKPLTHLDSGVVHEGVLYCAHSNYPGLPMTSSIEMWDAAGLKHRGSHSFGIFAGSATWVDRWRGKWYVTFGHYRGRADEADRDPRWTTLVEFDTEWRQRQAWVYPAEVVSRLGDYSISGGVFTPEGKLYCTGHDNAEVYVVRLPEGGSSLVLEEIFDVPMHGQGIALDPADAGVLYGIDRARRELVVTRLREG